MSLIPGYRGTDVLYREHLERTGQDEFQILTDEEKAELNKYLLWLKENKCEDKILSDAERQEVLQKLKNLIQI